MRTKKQTAFHVQLDTCRVRVVLIRRQKAGPFYASFWWKNKQTYKSTDKHDEPSAKAEARNLVEEVVVSATATPLDLGDAIAKSLRDRWPRLEEMKRAEERKDLGTIVPIQLTPDEQRQKAHWSVTRLQLAKFKEFAGKETKITALSFGAAKKLVQRYIDARKKTNAKPQSIIDEQRIISAFFSWLIKEDFVAWTGNPAFKLFIKDLPKVHRKPKKPVSESDLKVLLQKARNTTVWPSLLLCLQTGLRPIGTTRVAWSDVDFEKCCVTIHEKRATRNAPLSAWMAAELKAWRESHPEDAMLINCHKNTLHNHLQRIRERNNLGPEVTLQGCRRTFISMCLDAGHRAELVAAIAGNSVKVIEHHYKNFATMKSAHVPESISVEGFLKLDDHSKNHSTQAG